MLDFRKVNNIGGWTVFAIATVVYWLTMEETASFWDCGEFIAVSYKLEVPHPPGAPFFLLMGRMFSFLALGDVTQVAYWINFLSVLSSSFSILFLFWTISLLGRKIIKPDEKGNLSTGQLLTLMGGAAVGSLAYTFSDTFWFSATEAEVYGMSSFFTAFVFWAILKWELIEDNAAQNRWLIMIAYMMGLSIGVHLLNLVTIPALGLIYYYKKHKQITSAMMMKALLFSIMLILMLVFPYSNFIIIPALIAYFIYKHSDKESSSVSSINKENNNEITPLGIISTLMISGAFIIVIMVGIIPGLPSIAGNFEIYFVNELGLPFNSGALFFAVLLIGSLVYGIHYTQVNKKELANKVLLSLAFILIGYSSYAIVLIRSNYNPPIDENNPEDIISFVSYLKREQYGDRPLLFGRTFESERIPGQEGIEKGAALYRKGENKYEIYDYKTTPLYKKKDQMLLPRIYSQQGGHEQLYREWIGMSSKEKPTFFHNIYYLFRYQFGHMYFRYFMWNFSGRDGDEKDAQYLTIFDTPEEVPYEVGWNKARNNFFMLPLALGILGLFFQWVKDEKNFWVTLLLFFLTGLALVLYLNSPPVEPRERDYIYVGSFYVFAIWIGFGVFQLAEMLGKFIKNETILPVIVTVMCMSAPVIMATEGWDNHDRSGRFHSIDQAKNTLRSCAPNAILFTGGDNDTFPLWYVQEVEGFRTDVRVVVLSYLSTDWYIDQMKRQAYKSAPLPISMEKPTYIQGKNDYLPLVENPNFKGKAVNLKTYMNLLKKNDPRVLVQLQDESFTGKLPSRYFALNIDKNKVLQEGFIPKGKEERILDRLKFGLKEGKRAIFKNDLAILDMLATNNWERPIYFNNTSANTSGLDLRPYLQLEGMAYRLMPIKVIDTGEVGEVNTDVMLKNLKSFEFRGFDNPNTYNDEEYKKFGSNIRNAYYRLADQLIIDGREAEAKEVLDLSIKNIPDETIPYSYFLPRYIDSYYQLGENEIADNLGKLITDRAKENLDYVIKKLKEDGQDNEQLRQRSILILNQMSSIFRRAEQRVSGKIALHKQLQELGDLENEGIELNDSNTIDQLEKERAEFAAKYKSYYEDFERYYSELENARRRR